MSKFRYAPAHLVNANTVGLGSVATIGAVLSWLCRDYPARLPPWMPWDFSWLQFLAFALTLWWYGLGLSRTPAPLRPSRTRQLLFFAGLLATYTVLQTRFEYAAEHMFCLNRVQHLILHHLGPFLIALGWPGKTISRGMPGMTRRLFGASILRKALSVLRQPIIAGTVFVGLIFLWLIPAVHFRAMIDPRLYALMNWSMLVDGLLFWFLVMDPRPTPPARLSRASGILLSLAVQVPQIAGGALIGFANHSYYTYYDLCGRLLPSVSAVLDQEIGGSIIWLGGGMMSAAAALVLFERIWRDETAQSALQACD